MRATLDRIADALCAGRAPVAVIMTLATALGIAGMLWLSACVFLMMEPLA